MKLSRFRSVLLALACSAGLLHADIVVLKDGKRLEGSITAETPQSVKMHYKLTAKIWDDKDIPRTEIVEIIKQKPEEVELIELQKLVPTPDLMTAEKYEGLIQDRLRPFVNRYPGTKEAAEVEKMVAIAQEEKEKVVAGGVKLEGKWLTPEETKADKLNIDAYSLRAAMMEKVEAKDYSAALKQFDKLTDPRGSNLASIYYPKAVEEALAILTLYEKQIEQMIKDQPTLVKMREDNMKKLIDPDLSRMKSAIEREREQWKSNYDLESKATRWYTPYKYDLPSLKTLSQTITAEKNRLKTVDIAVITKVNDILKRLMSADAKASQSADELKKMADAITEFGAAAGNADATSKQFYGNVYNLYVQRYNYAQQVLASKPAPGQVQAGVTAAGGSSAIAGVGTPGMDDKVAAALAAAGGTAPPAPGVAPVGAPAVGAAPAPGTAAVPGAAAPQVMPTAPAAGYPAAVPGAVAPAGYPQQPQQAPAAAYGQPPAAYGQQPAAYAQQPGVPTAAPMPVAPPPAPVEEEGISNQNLILIGVGVVVLVLLLTLLGGKKKKK